MYSTRLNDQTTIGLGLPFSDITYKPDDKWTIKLQYLVPDFGTASVEYAVTENFRVFAELDQRSHAFHWNELADGDDRVLFEQKRAEVGVRGTFDDRFGFVLAGGYAFGQSFDVGFDSRDSDQIAEPSDEPYVRLAVEAKF
jgi:hypothetical protein